MNEKRLNMFENLPDVLTISQCQEALQIGRCSMIDIIKNGEIDAVKVKGMWRVRKEELERYLNRK